MLEANGSHFEWISSSDHIWGGILWDMPIPSQWYQILLPPFPRSHIDTIPWDIPYFSGHYRLCCTLLGLAFRIFAPTWFRLPRKIPDDAERSTPLVAIVRRLNNDWQMAENPGVLWNVLQPDDGLMTVGRIAAG